jgi:AmiR/NasT family two-component response regulator
MRATVAKRLRREAESVTTGLPTRQLMKRAKDGVIFNEPKTTLAFYRHLKRNQAQLRR